LKSPHVLHSTPRWFGLLILAVVASACAQQESASRQASASPLPNLLHGMELVQASAGRDAAAMIERLHRKDVAPDQTYIGHYGTGPSHAMLYVSLFESEDEAESVLEDMSTDIGEGSSGFGHHGTFAVDGTEIHLVLGQGQVHFFFVKGVNLTWLAMVPEMARVGLAQLLEVGAEAVPPLDSLLARP